MAGLPQLIDDDVQVMDASLDELLRKSEAIGALLIDKGGPLICQRGALDNFDTPTMAALAAGSFCATQAMAERVGETTFNTIYQQGATLSLYVCNIDENVLLIVLFNASMSVGVVKYYSLATVAQITTQLRRAAFRAPGKTLDLVSLNILDASVIFRRNATLPPAASA